MLTPDQIKQASKVLGAPPTAAGTQSGSDPWASYDSKFKTAPTTPTPDTSFGGRVQQDVANRGNAVLKSTDYLRTGTPNPQSDFSTGMQIGGNTLGLANDVVGEAVKSVPGAQAASQAFNDTLIPKPIQMVQQFVMDKLGKPLWDAFSAKHPEAAADLGALGEATQFAGTAVGGKQALEEAPALVKQGASAVGDALASAKSTISDAVGNITGKLVVKTPEEVLATPRDLAGKLTPTQYSAWEQNQNKLLADSQKAEQAALDAKHQGEQNMTSQQKQSEQDLLSQKHSQQQTALQQEHQANLDNIAQTTQAKTDQLLAEGDTLKKSLVDSSRTNAVNARQPIKNWIQDSGQHYRDLVEEQLAPKAKVVVNNPDVSAEVDKAFGADPVMAGKVKNALGLTEQVDPMTGTPTKLKPTTTIGKLYEQAKGLRQGIGNAAKNGARVFTPDEVVTQNAVRIVSKILENNGVDLSAANKFWSEYAPVRNAAVSKFQPFDTNQIKVNVGARTLQQAAQGTNADSAALVKKIEDSTGVSLTNDLKTVIEKMTTNQRQMAIEKFNAEEAKITAGAAKQQGADSLKIQQNAEQEALAQKHASEASSLEQKHGAEQQQLGDKKSGETQQLKNSNLATKTQAERQALIKKILGGIVKTGVTFEGIKAGIVHHL